MAILLAETFSGANIVTTGAGTSLYGFDNPTSVWNDSAFVQQQMPIIDAAFPCPVGAPNSIRFPIDAGHLDAVQPFNLREWWARYYIRLGDANGYSCDYNDGITQGGVHWAKVWRNYGQSWAWNFIADTWDSNTEFRVIQEVPINFSVFGDGVVPGLTPCKWYYTEFHVRLNTPGQSDGLADLWLRNVSDNLPLNHWGATNQNYVNALTQTLETFRVGGNGYYNPNIPANGLIRYANVALATARIGEAGGGPPPPVYAGTMTLQVP